MLSANANKVRRHCIRPTLACSRRRGSSSPHLLSVCLRRRCRHERRSAGCHRWGPSARGTTTQRFRCDHSPILCVDSARCLRGPGCHRGCLAGMICRTAALNSSPVAPSSLRPHPRTRGLFRRLMRCSPPVQVVEEIFDKAAASKMGIDRKDQICIMIHSGSRGFGHQVSEAPRVCVCVLGEMCGSPSASTPSLRCIVCSPHLACGTCAGGN